MFPTSFIVVIEKLNFGGQLIIIKLITLSIQRLVGQGIGWSPLTKEISSFCHNFFLCYFLFLLHVQYFKHILYPTLCCIIGVDVKVVIVVIIVVIVIVVVIVVVVVGVDDVDDCLHRDQHEWHEPKSWELGSRRAEVSGGVGTGHGDLAIWEN